jgi:hypothetical protein
MTLMTWMILHPQMALISNHILVEIKHPTHIHPLGQRTGINVLINPTIVIKLDPITIGVTMGNVHMTVDIEAPLTH